MYTKVKIESIKTGSKNSKSNIYKDTNDSTSIILDDEIYCCSPKNGSSIIIIPTHLKTKSQVFTPAILSDRSTSTIIEKFVDNFDNNEKNYENKDKEKKISEIIPQEIIINQKNEEKSEEKNEEKNDESNTILVSKSGKNVKKIINSILKKDKEKQNSIKNRISAKVKTKNINDNNKNNIIYNKVVKKKFVNFPEENNNKEKKRKISISPPSSEEKPLGKNRRRRNSTVKIYSNDYKKYITNKLNEDKSKNTFKCVQKTSKHLNKANINKDDFIKINAAAQKKVNFYDKTLKKQILKKNNQKSLNLENPNENKSSFYKRFSQKKISKNNEKTNEDPTSINSLYISKNNQLLEQKNKKDDIITPSEIQLEKINNKSKTIIKKSSIQHNNNTNKNSVKFRPLSSHKTKKEKNNEQLLNSFIKNDDNNNNLNSNFSQKNSARIKNQSNKFLLNKKKEKSSEKSFTSSNNSDSIYDEDSPLQKTNSHKRKNTILTDKDHLELKNLNKENIESYSNKEKIDNFNEHLELCLETIIDLDIKSQPRIKMDINFNFPKELQNKKIALFDLDETLIHCVGEIKPNQNPELKYDDKISVNLPMGRKAIIGINERPLWRESLDKIKQYYNIVIYTASHSSYSDAILNFLDKDDKYFHYRLYRNNCVQCTSSDGMKFYVKDLDILKKYYDLKDIIIIDNSVLSFTFHLNNGIPVIPYYDSKDDRELNLVALYLLSVVDCNDLRVENEKHFQLQKCLEIAKKNKECEESNSSEEILSSNGNENENKNNNDNNTRGNSAKNIDGNKKENEIETIDNIGKQFTCDFLNKVGRISFHLNTYKFQLNNLEKIRTDRKSGSSIDNKMSYIKVLREVYKKYAERGTIQKKNTTFRNSVKKTFNKKI